MRWKKVKKKRSNRSQIYTITFFLCQVIKSKTVGKKERRYGGFNLFCCEFVVRRKSEGICLGLGRAEQNDQSGLGGGFSGQGTIRLGSKSLSDIMHVNHHRVIRIKIYYGHYKNC